jgi:hypothetical protein
VRREVVPQVGGAAGLRLEVEVARAGPVAGGEALDRGADGARVEPVGGEGPPDDVVVADLEGQGADYSFSSG